MAQARRTKEAKSLPRLTTHIGRGVREGVLFVLLAVGLFLLAAMITYNPADPGWSHAGPRDVIHNYTGHAGAWFADVFLYLFGYLSYLFPFMIAYSGWLVLRGKREDQVVDYKILSMRWFGFFLTLIAGCSLASIHFYIAAGILPLDGGGILGRYLGNALIDVFGLLGSTLLLLAVLMGGVTLFTGLTWLGIMDVIGMLCLKMFELSVSKIQQFRESKEVKKAGEVAKKARKEIVRKEQQKAVNRKTPVRIEPVIKKPEVSERAIKESQIQLFDAPNTTIPPLRLLDDAKHTASGFSKEALEALSKLVELKLADFGVEVEVVAVHPGPVITRFELDLAPGIKAAKITALSKDLARSLSVPSVRVVEVIPGKSVVGLEIPNEDREIVYLSEILQSKEFDKATSPLTVGLGKDISGNSVVADISKMPHLLVAGTTGSGKSVGINTMLISLLYKSTPQELRLIMVDPKMLELNVYDDIPHLLTPVVTDMSDAANALRWSVGEMEKRYKLMAALGVRNITGYNKKVNDAINAGAAIKDPLFKRKDAEEGAEPEDLKSLPYIVIVIDEFADLIMVVGKKIEELIARLAQKARACGIHLILATQRPSVDVITGLIKSNIPSRIAFQVSSRIDSRTILDQMGAEQLLGHGDMLYMNAGQNIPERVHGAFVDDHEVHNVVNHIKEQGKPEYISSILEDNSEAGMLPGEVAANKEGDSDVLYDEAVKIVTESRKASISYVQRRLRIGYNRAASMIEEMEASGVVSGMQTNGSREVLAPPPVDV
ncbi:MAG: DNA translocase FtsK 4TM domain-containing protein [Gammaproteobacteria bacterium]|nr:DNA translocase FtsK 4TM domain-containing protein [Gammaproteobacteria bacterium]